MNDAEGNAEREHRVDTSHEQCWCGDPVCAALPVGFLAKWVSKAFLSYSASRIYILATEFRPDNYVSFQEHAGYFEELVRFAAALRRVIHVCRFTTGTMGDILTSCERSAMLIRDQVNGHLSSSSNVREEWITQAKAGVLRKLWKESLRLNDQANDHYGRHFLDDALNGQESKSSMPIHKVGRRLCCGKDIGQGPQTQRRAGRQA